MAPSNSCLLSNSSLIPESVFAARSRNYLRKFNILPKSSKQTLSSQRFLLPLSTSVRLFPPFKGGSALYSKSRVPLVSATGSDIAVEEPDYPVSQKDNDVAPEIPSNAVETTEESSVSAPATQTKRLKSSRKSDMPPVTNEELIPGATFTGKVRSIHPFGAFVDFGAFTDGLVHVSKLSDNFVKDVGNVVSVGQEVKVRLIEANMETGRISLTMRETDDVNKQVQEQKDGPPSDAKSPPPRKTNSRSNQKTFEVKKSSKFVMGQDLEGTVKNLTRIGAYISLPEGEEGFLPLSEESNEGFENVMGGSSLQVGQEVSVRVLRISRKQVTLTMKREEDVAELDSKLSQGVVHTATNPFVLAFRNNKDIAAFLDERKKVEESKQVEGKVEQATTEVENVVGGVAHEEVKSQENVGESDPTGETPDLILAMENPVETTLEDVIVEIGDQKRQTTDAENELLSEKLVEGKKVESISENAGESDPTGQTPDHISALDNSVESAVNDVGVDRDDEKTQTTDVENKSFVEKTLEDEKVESISDEIVVEPDPCGKSPDNSVESAVDDVGVERVDKKTQTTDVENKSFLEKPSEDEKVESISDEIVREPGPSGESPDDSINSALNDVHVERDDEKTNTTDVENKSFVEKTLEDEKVESISDEIVGEPDPSGKSHDSSVESALNYVGVERDDKKAQTTDVENKLFVQKPSEDDKVESISDENVRELDPSGESPDDSGESALDDVGVERVDEKTQTADVASKSFVEKPLEDEKVESTFEEIVGEPDPSGESPDHISMLENSTESTLDDVSMEIDDQKRQTTDSENELVSEKLVEDKVEPSIEENGTIRSSNGQTAGSTTKATISPALVKQLREDTGAGMMDCKNALSESQGDIVKAQELLRKKGLASADKKSSRATAEGKIGSYIHDSRIGVLVEVNCETDFVSRGEIFKELVDDLAMQVAACPQVKYLNAEDVSQEIIDKERKIEMQKEDLLSKPEQIRAKIVEGRIRKRLDELALLEQPYIKNDKVAVKDWVKQTIATVGENIKVKRFVRFNLGEGLEKKSQDFAAEVAAQTAAKPSAPGKEQPPEAKGTVEKVPAVTVSATLVKQLREETGAGMMDCKKALAETGGDLEKAQEYLRKKGLSSADKKSSRLVAEGRIGSYIHDSRVGVLIEVNCETDFVGRSEKFKELVDDLAMQVVACPQVQFVSIEDIPESIVKKEKELEMQREDLLSKPENIRERIVEGRISKRLGELALLEQPFIRNDAILVKDLVKQVVAALGENIKVRRFVRFTLGEETGDVKIETKP